ncbi:hypothetical protein Y1Q_0000924 [Alligator mississippiensis]|uniref:Myb/SANT-like DNA-binding domain-containing protein n=1 Tax=Alligator mississippiensis TaxID=8496 RepID=A0A151NEF9_ALLMI|nr:hypothetical protein Y1Q_0000924 [Alligator mississippiensis]
MLLFEFSGTKCLIADTSRCLGRKLSFPMSQKNKSSSMQVTEQEADTSITWGSNWTWEELKDLINTWLDQKIVDQLESRRNKPVYAVIAKEMKVQGHNWDWTQCQSKIKALRYARKCVTSDFYQVQYQPGTCFRTSACTTAEC